MGKQTLLQTLTEFSQKFNSNPFEDFYIFLILRFLIYIYLFLKLSDILLGYARPNLKTRVLRKFQFVYGQQILKDLDNQDMKQLQQTINNTISNATKDLNAQSLNKYSSHKVAICMYQDKQNGKCQSQRRSLAKDSTADISLSSLSRKSQKSVLRFDLDRNDYYDPPSSKNSVISEIQNQEAYNNQISGSDLTQDQQIEGEQQQETLSPSRKNDLKRKRINQQQNLSKTQNNIISKISNVQNRSISYQEEANIHYPANEEEGMDLQIEQKFVKQQQDLLHLSEENINNSMEGKQSKQDNQKEQLQFFPSIIKSDSTKITQNSIEQIDL